MVLLCVSIGYAGVKISDMTALTSVTTSDTVAIVDATAATVTKKATVGNVLAAGAHLDSSGNVTDFAISAPATGSSTIDLTISTTTAGGETGIYSYPTHITNALTGELIAVRGSARVDTIDSAAGTVMGGKFQAGNMGTGTDLSVVRGVYSEVVNKTPSGATTWTYARGYEANMDLDQGTSGNANTITNAYMFYGNYNLPTTATYSTVTNGYGIYVSNEAVGGTGQTLDAAFLATDVNMGVSGWDYGIDFNSIGSNGFNTADIRGNNGEIIHNNTDGSWDFGTAIIEIDQGKLADDSVIDDDIDWASVTLDDLDDKTISVNLEVQDSWNFSFGDDDDLSWAWEIADAPETIAATWMGLDSSDNAVFWFDVANKSINVAAVASPEITLYDSDSDTGDTNLVDIRADQVAGAFGADFTTVTNGSEVSDVWISWMKAGTKTPGFTIDGSASHAIVENSLALSAGSLTPVTDDADDFDDTGPDIFAGVNLYGGTFVANGAGTINLPVMAVGMNFTIITSGNIAVVIDTNAADGYLHNGVTGTEGKNLTNLSATGDIAVVQYYTADDWLITTNGWTPE